MVDIVGVWYISLWCYIQFWSACRWHHACFWSCLSLGSEKIVFTSLQFCWHNSLKFSMQGIFIQLVFGVSLLYLWWRIFPCMLSGNIWSLLMVCEFMSFTGRKIPMTLPWSRDLELDCVFSVQDKWFAFVFVVNPHQLSRPKESEVGWEECRLLYISVL